MTTNINLYQEIENARLLLLQTAEEKKDLNHALVLRYSVILDELIFKAQKKSVIIQ